MNREPGQKFDQGKLRWDLLPFKEVEELVEVITYGANKYEDNNWKNVRPFKSRYFAALCRHLFAWWIGSKFDESGKTHLAHAGCCILFLMWGDKQGEINETEASEENNCLYQENDISQKMGGQLKNTNYWRNSKKKQCLLVNCQEGNERPRKRRKSTKLWLNRIFCKK